MELGFDSRKIREKADPALYRRGKAYFEEGRVFLRDVAPGFARAAVYGTKAYVAEVRVDGEVLSGSCNCPYSEGRIVCKHVVATGLAALDAPVPRSDTALVAGYLDSLPREALADLVMQATSADPDRFDLLKREAMRESGDAAEVSTSAESEVRDAVRLLEAGGGLAMQPVEDAIEALSLMLGRGMFEAAERSAWRLAEALRSEGARLPQELAERWTCDAASVHARASLSLGRDPDEVAERAFALLAEGNPYGPEFGAYAEEMGEAFISRWVGLAKESAGD